MLSLVSSMLNLEPGKAHDLTAENFEHLAVKTYLEADADEDGSLFKLELFNYLTDRRASVLYC